MSNGNELTHLTQEAFEENIEIAGKIGHLVDKISEASQEQAQGIEQVNKTIAEMDRVSQQNAANSEESAAASEEMTVQAGQIYRFVEDLVRVVEGRVKKDRHVTNGYENQAEEKFYPQPASGQIVVNHFSKPDSL